MATGLRTLAAASASVAYVAGQVATALTWGSGPGWCFAVVLVVIVRRHSGVRSGTASATSHDRGSAMSRVLFIGSAGLIVARLLELGGTVLSHRATSTVHREHSARVSRSMSIC
jgi:hypothetical protein